MPTEAVPLSAAWQLPARAVTVRLSEGIHDRDTLDRLAALVAAHPGKVPLRMVLDLASPEGAEGVEGGRVMMEADRHSVAWSPGFLAGLTDLLGPGSVRAAVTLGSGRRRESNGRPGAGRAPARVG